MLRVFRSSRVLSSSSSSSSSSFSVKWRALSSSAAASSFSLHAEFDRKVALGKSLPALDDNQSKLRMYSLFKQANAGKNTTPKPSGVFDFVGKAKWDAWTQLGDMPPDEAMRQYIAIIDDLARQHGVDPSGDGTAATTATSASQAPAASDDLIIQLSEAGLLTIQLNRSTRYNALNRGMYSGIVDALASSATNAAVKAVLLKASGPMFSSGNDLAMFSAASGQSFEDLAEEGAQLLERFVNAFIVYPKPVVAAVQGPAMGIAVTTLALCDLVYVSETTTFHTPFTALGQSPEACSSLLFPRIMGSARANAMLLLGEKMTAQDAVDSGFATDAFGVAEFDDKVKQKVDLLLSRYPNSMQKSKALIRSPTWIAELQETNRRECDVLKKLWLGVECMDAIMKFESRKQ